MPPHFGDLSVFSAEIIDFIIGVPPVLPTNIYFSFSVWRKSA